MRLTAVILAILAVWFPTAYWLGNQYDPPKRPPVEATPLYKFGKFGEGEFMYSTWFPNEWGDVVLYENDRPLGPVASTGDIKRIGLGRYRRDDNALFFSTSDNSDPQTNGRQYYWARR